MADQHHGLHHLFSLLTGKFSLQDVTSYVLCFIAASISSAGGVGGGSLFLPILNLVSGLNLKIATTFSAFMVTGGSISNVLYHIFVKSSTCKTNNKSLIDFEIALLSEPCMLLGVSIGVVCNVVFPEWLITILFAIFLAFSTYKTCKAGFSCWKAESNEAVFCRVDDDGGEKGFLKEALLDDAKAEEELQRGWEIPWAKLIVLVIVWLSFFGLHILIANKDGKSIIGLRPCGIGYWLIQLFQIPLAIAFTYYVLREKAQSDLNIVNNEQKDGMVDVGTVQGTNVSPMVVFPLAALLSGILGGLFGIGGGLLINPVLLQIGVPPQITAATTSFMVLFSSSMSSVQYIILGMTEFNRALNYALICSVASIVGLIIIQKAIKKSGRASYIVFSVSLVMALSTISITSFGAIDVWRAYASGNSLGFRSPC